MLSGLSIGGRESSGRSEKLTSFMVLIRSFYQGVGGGSQM